MNAPFYITSIADPLSTFKLVHLAHLGRVDIDKNVLPESVDEGHLPRDTMLPHFAVEELPVLIYGRQRPVHPVLFVDAGDVGGRPLHLEGRRAAGESCQTTPVTGVSGTAAAGGAGRSLHGGVGGVVVVRQIETRRRGGGSRRGDGADLVWESRGDGADQSWVVVGTAGRRTAGGLVLEGEWGPGRGTAGLVLERGVGTGTAEQTGLVLERGIKFGERVLRGRGAKEFPEGWVSLDLSDDARSRPTDRGTRSQRASRRGGPSLSSSARGGPSWGRTAGLCWRGVSNSGGRGDGLQVWCWKDAGAVVGTGTNCRSGVGEGYAVVGSRPGVACWRGVSNSDQNDPVSFARDG